MGLNEQADSDKRWNYAPKKKWKHCYMSFGGIKEEASDSVAKEKYSAQVVAEDSQKEANGVCHLDAPYLSTALTGSPKHKGVATNSGPEEIGGDWPVICKQEHDDSRKKLHILAPASGPLAGLRGALQAHSDLMAKGRGDVSEHGGVYSFKGIDHDERRAGVCSQVLSKGRLAGGFIPTNGVLHSTNQVGKELCTIKDELGRKRISMANAAARDASLRSTPSREVHNKLEKNRRAHLKECFELLRRQLPSMEDKKISNQTILKAAFRYIQTLKRKERELEHEMERLARAKIALQQNVSSLKKELQSKYDHMDFSAILPDSSALELMKDKDTKSTTTASEQPDYEDRYAASDVQMSIPKSPHNTAPDYDERTKLTRPQTDYDQPLNLSTAQASTEDSTSDWDRMEVDRNGPRVLTTSNGTTAAKCSPVFYKDSSDRPLNGVPGSHAGGLNTNCIISTEVPTAVAGSHITQISLPPTALAGSLTSIGGLPAVGTTQVAHFPQIVKTGTSVSQLPPTAKVVTAWPSNHAVLTESPAVINQSHSYAANVHQLTVSGGVAKIPSINCSTITRVSTDAAAPTTTTSVTHALPLVAGGGLHIPAQLLTNNVHLGTQAANVISPQAIQVLTPEGYKLVAAEGGINGSKPVTIFAQADGLDNFSEDGKTGPFVVSVNKNGLSAFHLTVPAAVTRSISASSQGTTLPMTSLPLNLTVGGTSPLKITQAGSTSMLPSYIPLANSNGMARLLPSMSVVGPLVVSPSPQRGVVIPTVSASFGKTKAQVSNPLSGTSVPLVSAQYASTLAGGLVNSVVMVSAAPSAVTSSNTSGNKQ